MSYLADQVAAGPRVALAIPAEKAQDVIYIIGVGMMEWVDVVGTGAFSGYRCLEVGRPEFGSTASPRGYELDMTGGLAPKAAYASLWAWAQQNGHSVTTATWTAKVFKFADVDATYFRLPDLRDMFLRFTGTNADTSAVRALGSNQSFMNASHQHSQTSTGAGGGIANMTMKVIGNVGTESGDNNTTGASGGAEARPVNTAFSPRVHI